MKANYRPPECRALSICYPFLAWGFASSCPADEPKPPPDPATGPAGATAERDGAASLADAASLGDSPPKEQCVSACGETLCLLLTRVSRTTHTSVKAADRIKGGSRAIVRALRASELAVDQAYLKCRQRVLLRRQLRRSSPDARR